MHRHARTAGGAGRRSPPSRCAAPMRRRRTRTGRARCRRPARSPAPSIRFRPWPVRGASLRSAGAPLTPAAPCRRPRRRRWAILAGHAALFSTAADLLLDLNGQETARALERRLRHYVRPALLVIDELGYLAYDARGGGRTNRFSCSATERSRTIDRKPSTSARSRHKRRHGTGSATADSGSRAAESAPRRCTRRENSS